MYKIRSGRVRVIVGNANTKKQVAVLVRGNVFGEIAYFSPSKTRTATCVAEGNTILSLVGRSGKPPVVFPTTESSSATKMCTGNTSIFNGKEVEYKEGAIIIEQNDIGSCFYVVLSGTVDVSILPDKKIVNTMFAGEIFGESVIGVNKTRTSSCTARTKVTVLKMEIPKVPEHNEK